MTSEISEVRKIRKKFRSHRSDMLELNSEYLEYMQHKTPAKNKLKFQMNREEEEIVLRNFVVTDEALKAAVPFVFPDHPLEAQISDDERSVAMITNLPHPEILLEFQSSSKQYKHRGLLIFDSGETAEKIGLPVNHRAIMPVIFRKGDDGSIERDLSLGIIWINRETLEVSLMNGFSVNTEKQYIEKNLQINVVLATYGLLLLAAESTRALPIPGLKLRKSRSKKSFPEKDYNVVLIDPDATYSNAGRGGTHASPQLHWRRAHMRTLQSGKRVPVQRCLVGVGDKVREQVYKVKPSL